MNLIHLAQSYNLEEIDQKLGENYWSPLDVAQVNNWMLRAAAFKGEFHWHTHEHDELFYIYKGSITIDTQQGPIELTEGQGVVIPKGMQHKPHAQERAVVLMLDPVEADLKGSIRSN